LHLNADLRNIIVCIIYYKKFGDSLCNDSIVIITVEATSADVEPLLYQNEAVCQMHQINELNAT